MANEPWKIIADGEGQRWERADDSGDYANLTVNADGSVARMPLVMAINVIPVTTDVATGDNQGFAWVGPEFAGCVLVGVRAYHAVPGSGTGDTTIAVRRDRAGTIVEMLSTSLTIDSGERNHTTAAVAAVINTSNDDVQDGDLIRIDIDDVPATTAPKGLGVHLVFHRA